MDAEFSPNSASQLCKTIISHFSQLQFVENDTFYWSAKDKIVYFARCQSEEDIAFLLHECAHALLQHEDFSHDLALVQMEAAAWEYAQQTLAPQHSITLDQNLIDESIESYKIWLFDRSLCPKCSHNGLQTKTSTYQCINCECSWKVNDARQCRLRRLALSS